MQTPADIQTLLEKNRLLSGTRQLPTIGLPPAPPYDPHAAMTTGTSYFDRQGVTTSPFSDEELHPKDVKCNYPQEKDYGVTLHGSEGVTTPGNLGLELHPATGDMSRRSVTTSPFFNEELHFLEDEDHGSVTTPWFSGEKLHSLKGNDEKGVTQVNNIRSNLISTEYLKLHPFDIQTSHHLDTSISPPSEGSATWSAPWGAHSTCGFEEVVSPHSGQVGDMELHHGDVGARLGAADPMSPGFMDYWRDLHPGTAPHLFDGIHHTIDVRIFEGASRKGFADCRAKININSRHGQFATQAVSQQWQSYKVDSSLTTNLNGWFKEANRHQGQTFKRDRSRLRSRARDIESTTAGETRIGSVVKTNRKHFHNREERDERGYVIRKAKPPVTHFTKEIIPITGVILTIAEDRSHADIEIHWINWAYRIRLFPLATVKMAGERVQTFEGSWRRSATHMPYLIN